MTEFETFKMAWLQAELRAHQEEEARLWAKLEAVRSDPLRQLSDLAVHGADITVHHRIGGTRWSFPWRVRIVAEGVSVEEFGATLEEAVLASVHALTGR